MKRLFLTLTAMILFTLNAVSDVKISEYANSHGETYPITLLSKNDKPYMVSMRCGSKDGDGEIWIKPKEVEKFTAFLKDVLSKYDEWSEVAVSNNVEDATKDFPFKSPKVELVWGRTTTFFAKNNLSARWVYKQVSGITANVAILSARVTAENNRFAKETFSLSFYNKSDIENLIEALSPENIEKSIATLGQTELFK